VAGPPVPRVERGWKRARQEPTPERGEGDERRSVAGAPRDDVVETLPSPQRQFGLDAGDRVNGMRPVELADPGFGEPKRTNLALINEVGHRAPGLLNRNRGIHAVELVQVDDVNPEPAQGAVDPRPNVLRTPVIRHAEGRGV